LPLTFLGRLLGQTTISEAVLAAAVAVNASCTVAGRGAVAVGCSLAGVPQKARFEALRRGGAAAKRLGSIFGVVLAEETSAAIARDGNRLAFGILNASRMLETS
jgi:hypothetical protein